MDPTILKLLTNMLTGQNQNVSSLFGGNNQPNPTQSPASNLYPPEANFPRQQPQQSQPNLSSLLSSILGKNFGDLSSIVSKLDTKKEEDSSPSDVIL